MVLFGADMTRSVDEWIGANDDAAIPQRVRLRVFERFGGICQLTGRKIMPGDAWDLDHVRALAMGGEHRESNLVPVLKAAHREKTKQDVKDLAKARSVKARHIGIKQSRNPLPGSKASGWKRKMNGEWVKR